MSRHASRHASRFCHLLLAAVFGLRLLALFPALLSAPAVLSQAGVAVCTASGEHILPASGAPVLAVDCPAFHLAADATMLPGAAMAATPPTWIAFHLAWSVLRLVPIWRRRQIYPARAPPFVPA